MRLPLATLLLAAVTALSGCGVGSGMVMNTSGRGNFQAGNYAAAADDFAKASMDNPSNATYAYNLGRSLAKIGRTAEAEHHFRRALAIDPRHQPTYHGLSELLADSGREVEAERLLTGWATTQPHLPAAHIELAAMKARTGDFATAESALKQAIAVDPSSPTALAKLGELYHTTGQTPEAVAMYQQSLMKNPFQQQVKSRVAALTAPPVSIRQAAGVPAPQMVAGRANPAGLPQMSAYQPVVPFGVPPFTPRAMAFSPWQPAAAGRPAPPSNYAPLQSVAGSFGSVPPRAEGIRPGQWPAGVASQMTPTMAAPQYASPQYAAPQMAMPTMAGPQIAAPQMATQPGATAVTPASGRPAGSIQPIHHETLSPPSWNDDAAGEPVVVPAF